MSAVQYNELVGVIGGLGPKASSHFYDQLVVEARFKLFKALHSAKDSSERLRNIRKLSSASWSTDEVESLWQQTSQSEFADDQHHIPLILLNVPQTPHRPAFILKQSKADPGPGLIRASEALVMAGATKLCMVCNTAHFFLDRITSSLANKGLKVDFLNMLELTLDFIQRKYGSSKAKPITVGVLGTSGSLKTRIFEIMAEKPQFNGKIRIVTPLTDGIGEQENITKAILGAKAGFTNVTGCARSKENLSLVLLEAKKLIDAGTDAIILGCTELPLLTQSLDPDTHEIASKFVNPSKILADAVLKLGLLSREEEE